MQPQLSHSDENRSATIWYPSHDALSSSGARFNYTAVVVLRSIFFILAIGATANVLELGTPWGLVGVGAALGVATGSYVAFSRLKSLGVALAFGTALVGYLFLRDAALAFPHALRSRFFFLHDISLHVNLILLALLIAALATWLFWKFRTTVTIEVLLLAIAGVYSLSGHRNFRFDTPELISTLAWEAGVGNLTMLLILGSILLALLAVYLYFATLPGRPVANRQVLAMAHRGRRDVLIALLMAGVFGLGLSGILSGVFSFYSQQANSLTANGVGQSSSEGLSPLGFHSALGSTNQPSALVRLEGDYPQNPSVPMLYLRESALSEFNGHELVIADSRFDHDVAGVQPEQAYTAERDPNLTPRVDVSQSVYLLTDHKLVFGIDYPTSVVRLKNPNPTRFKGSFRVVSTAPTYSRDELRSTALGDSRWNEVTRNHYLVPHPDQRYSELARSVTAEALNSMDAAFLLADYLSKVSIYTLTPQHEVAKDQDPVAPYLFGDKRGYCVHFAHALVYMYRALGIPARIGTGYLTDLSQSKDGHILLRMSDRHAWAEVYFEGKGWVPFDVEPEQVESHAESQVDMKLLEDLMGMLEPGEEILSPELTKNEPGMQEEAWWHLFDRRIVILPLLALIVTLLIQKLVLLVGWRFSRTSSDLIRRGSIAIIATLYDLGIRRRFGETRQEFRDRLAKELSLETLRVLPLLHQSYYSAEREYGIDPGQCRTIIDSDLSHLRSTFGWRWHCGLLNPAAAWSRLWGNRW